MLRSQKVRELAPEMDPCAWEWDGNWMISRNREILIESTYGNSHPGSSHLNRFCGGSGERC